MRFKREKSTRKQNANNGNVDVLNPDTLDFLTVYQYCLIIISDSVVKAIRIYSIDSLCSSDEDDENDTNSINSNMKPSNLSNDRTIDSKDFRRVVKGLWLSYLNKFMTSDSNISDAFYRQREEVYSNNNTSNTNDYHDNSGSVGDGGGGVRNNTPNINKKYVDTRNYYNNTHPLHPSKPLLLGFVYLALRQLRTWVIPADIVRWCQQGLIPYNNLWQVSKQSIL